MSTGLLKVAEVLHKTRKAKVQKSLQGLSEWCHRHQPPKDQHAALSRRLRRHYQCFGVNGNSRSLSKVALQARRI